MATEKQLIQGDTMSPDEHKDWKRFRNEITQIGKESIINVLKEKKIFLGAEYIAESLRITINPISLSEIRKIANSHPKVKTITGNAGKCPLHCYYYTGEYAQLKEIHNLHSKNL